MPKCNLNRKQLNLRIGIRVSWLLKNRRKWFFSNMNFSTNKWLLLIFWKVILNLSLWGTRNKIIELEKILRETESNATNLSKCLQREKVTNEKLKNQLIEFKHTNSLLRMETDILGSRVTILTNSIRSLMDAKEAEEKNLMEVTVLNK